MTPVILHSDSQVTSDVVFVSIDQNDRKILKRSGDKGHKMWSGGVENFHAAISESANESNDIGNASVATLVEGIEKEIDLCKFGLNGCNLLLPKRFAWLLFVDFEFIEC